MPSTHSSFGQISMRTAQAAIINVHFHVASALAITYFSRLEEKKARHVLTRISLAIKSEPEIAPP